MLVGEGRRRSSDAWGSVRDVCAEVVGCRKVVVVSGGGKLWYVYLVECKWWVGTG